MKKIMFATLITASTAIMPGVMAADDIAGQIKADEVLFDQTMKKLDLDGETLLYIKNDNYGEFINRYAGCLDVWSRINPQMEMPFAMVKAGIIQFGDALDLDAVKAIGSSTKAAGKINNEPVYRSKNIYYTGDAKLTAPLYVLAGEDVKFKLAGKYIPENVLFAIGANLNVAEGWNSLKGQLQNSAIFSTLPDACESSIAGSLQVPVADFFASISGEYLFMATQSVNNGKPEIAGLLIMPDRNGTLSKVVKTQMAKFEMAETAGSYMFIPEGEKSFLPAWFNPGIKCVSGNVMLFSHPDVITAGDKNPLSGNADLKQYIFGGFEGISYGMINIQSDFAVASTQLLMDNLELPCNIDAVKLLTMPKAFWLEKRLPDGYYSEMLCNFSVNDACAAANTLNVLGTTMQYLQSRGQNSMNVDVGDESDYEEDEVLVVTDGDENDAADKKSADSVGNAEASDSKAAPQPIQKKLEIN
ncbi:MAG: hypothetical protein MST10_03990 [Lentisphaeria bacterium]|nr:hypothetical protein [Lentisphaeria bacterium]